MTQYFGRNLPRVDNANILFNDSGSGQFQLSPLQAHLAALFLTKQWMHFKFHDDVQSPFQSISEHNDFEPIQFKTDLITMMVSYHHECADASGDDIEEFIVHSTDKIYGGQVSLNVRRMEGSISGFGTVLNVMGDPIELMMVMMNNVTLADLYGITLDQAINGSDDFWIQLGKKRPWSRK